MQQLTESNMAAAAAAREMATAESGAVRMDELTARRTAPVHMRDLGTRWMARRYNIVRRVILCFTV